MSLRATITASPLSCARNGSSTNLRSSMRSSLREQLRVISPWLEDDQIDEVAHRITTYPSKNLLEPCLL
jgi:hypothetical protein